MSDSTATAGDRDKEGPGGPAAPSGPADTAADRGRGARSRAVFYAVAGLAVIGALVLGGRTLIGPLQQFAAWVQGLGIWGPVVFVLGYAVATVAFAPGSVLTLAAGALFGLVSGTIYTLAGATLGASLAFLVARYVARRAVERKIAGNQRFQAIDRAVGREGFKIVALLRLSPVFPFNLLNYALGLTRVRFWDYFAASVAMLPGTLLYVYYGKAAGSLASAFAGRGAPAAEAPSKGASWVLLGVGLLATVAVTTYVTRLAGKALRQELGKSGDPGEPGKPDPAAPTPTAPSPSPAGRETPHA
jgi:uncharacterized membrane protein YdjX (TVP38/TMEM64 family)